MKDLFSPTQPRLLSIQFPLILLIALFSACAQHTAEVPPLHVQAPAILNTATQTKTTASLHHAAIASAHPLATEAGFDTLAQGGNAFDAAITVAAVLGVVEPYSAGLGGGGFWLVQRPGEPAKVIDAREVAPLSLTAEHFKSEGNFDRDKAINGALAAGIPGQPAALAYLAEHYGRLPLSITLKPAIDYARNGFPIDDIYRQHIAQRQEALMRYSASHVLLPKTVEPHHDTIIKQSALAETLTTLANRGHAGFYTGHVAEQLIDSVRRGGGVWQMSDLSSYHVKIRAPIVGRFHNLTITSAPPPSAGGILLVDMLNMLENYDLKTLSTADRTHLMTEIMRRAYQQRAQYLGDPDFVDIPVETLTSKTFAQQQLSDFSWNHASPSQGSLATQEGTHTTHFSILDTAGNRVSATLSINLPFGSAFVAGETGVLLNNELDDFTLDLNGANAYGLTGSHANALEPGKRPLSSMSPTFVESTDWLGILGTPGGSRITTMVLLGLLEAADGKPPIDWVSRPRFHHQYLPDRIESEEGAFDADLMAELKGRGHTLNVLPRRYGNMQAILWQKSPENRVLSASDPRRIGQAIVADPNHWASPKTRRQEAVQ